MDQTQKGPLHSTPSILTPEKLLLFPPPGRDLLAIQLEAARAIDGLCQGLYNQSQQQSYFFLSVSFCVYFLASRTLHQHRHRYGHISRHKFQEDISAVTTEKCYPTVHFSSAQRFGVF